MIDNILKHHDHRMCYHKKCNFINGLIRPTLQIKSMATLSIAQKKEWAKLLFTKESLSQKEVASRVGVSEKTISKWVNDNEGAWLRLRQSIIVTKEEQLRRIYEQLDELNSVISLRGSGFRYATPKEADTMSKLTASARNLETEASLSDIIEVSKRLLNWLRSFDLEKAKEFSSVIDSFIKDQSR